VLDAEPLTADAVLDGGGKRPNRGFKSLDRGQSLVRFSRTFAMPNAETFAAKPIMEFVRAYLALSRDHW
jgi:hypothetical protein